MDERHGLSDGVEGESAPVVVQEHPDAGGIRSFDVYLVLVVAGGVAGVGAEQAPGLAVVADATVVAVARPLDAFIGDPNGCSLPAPFYLPVGGTPSERLLTQDLRQGVEPGGVVTVRLGVPL